MPEKVKCDFCGNEMEAAPETMKGFEKNACYECFLKFREKGDFSKIHVDIPMDKLNEVMPEFFVDSIMRDVFPSFFKEEKQNIKEMSKKEIAEYCFAAGVATLAASMSKMDKEFGKKGVNKIKKV